ncbi:hypothetical protein ABT214_05960 [Micromonospora purpureochromogenes]|uniref:hypothetical protein n=1 Tax=Micromonospora purpureochromogenes TaxID=47872 RepID=UPI0033325AD6
MSSADKIIAGLKSPGRSLRSIVEKAQSEADNEFTRLEREVERGRPISGLARYVYEEAKARRDGESGAE